MWPAVVILLLNATVPHTMLLTVRLEFGGIPINILDAALLLALVAIPFTKGDREPVDGEHPLLRWSVGLGLAMVVVGAVGGMLHVDADRAWLTWARNAINLPLSVLVGYSAMRYGRSAKTFVWVMIAASVLSAASLAWFVNDWRDGIAAGTAGFEQLRQVHFTGDGGLLAFSMIAFLTVQRVRIMPWWLSAAIFVGTFGAYSMLPHRSSWVLGAGTLLFALLVVPRIRLSRRIGLAVVGGVVTVGVFVSAVLVFSRITGRDFGKYLIERRLSTMLSDAELTTGATLTSSRWPGIRDELILFGQNPLIGVGYGYEARNAMMPGSGSFGHNIWSSAMAGAGIFGLMGLTVPLFGMVRVGLRMWRDSPESWFGLMGAIGALQGAAAMIQGTLSQGVNTQRAALGVGITLGLMLRLRQIQLTAVAWDLEQPSFLPAPAESDLDGTYGSHVGAGYGR